MDFLHRSANNQPQAARTNSQTSGAGTSVEKFHSQMADGQPKWIRVIFVVLLFSLTVLAIGIAILFYSGRVREAHLVDTTKEQAVFLTNGQVYFGKIKDINTQYLDLQNIFYLNSQSSQGSNSNSTPTSFSLVKLGCELHGPLDQMVINRQQVSFWENLSTTGKVAKAIDQWNTQNPNGQTCSDSSASNSTTQSQSTSSNSSSTSNTKQ